MAILEAVAGGATKVAFTLAQPTIKSKLDQHGFSAEHRAFRNCLLATFEWFQSKHPDWADSLFDLPFMEGKAAPILADLIRPGGRAPDPSDLAQAWGDRLNLSISRRRDRDALISAEEVSREFLEDLSARLRNEAALMDINKARALQNIQRDIAEYAKSARKALPEESTPGQYVEWIRTRNLYLDSRGTMQTQRQVQLPLTEIYVALSAREQAPHVTHSHAAWVVDPTSGLDDDVEEGSLGEVDLEEIVQRHSHVAVLGDPGSGKTTLLRYLGLRNAVALAGGAQSGPLPSDLKVPVILRAAGLAELGAEGNLSISDLLEPYHRAQECNVQGLGTYLNEKLALGHALVLIDGLDEVPDADGRRAMVRKLENFVRQHSATGNRFVITSRVAGYPEAPLGPAFHHCTVLEMTTSQQSNFLENWCRAVEDAETPDLPERERARVARREIAGIQSAISRSKGVARLATNPLLLRILALIHRTGAELPERRVELYKLAADTLARTWRVAQGVPESALVKEAYLTRLLSELATWLHINKPSGMATEREVSDVLAQAWGGMQRISWEGDAPIEVTEQVDNFLRAVREQTGLLVERAPNRFGFMHLTFEEYYACRQLVARRRETPTRIRQHLHDPRWREPILLALGFVGLDYPDEASELVEGAILAEGDLSEISNTKPSAYEDILGRDLLFALSSMADGIPIGAHLADRLLDALDSCFDGDDLRLRGNRFRTQLAGPLRQLAGGQHGHEICTSLSERILGSSRDDAVKAATALRWLPSEEQAAIVRAALQMPVDDTVISIVVAEAGPGMFGPLRDNYPDVFERVLEWCKAAEPDLSARALSSLIDDLEDVDPTHRGRLLGAAFGCLPDAQGPARAMLYSSLCAPDYLESEEEALRLLIEYSPDDVDELTELFLCLAYSFPFRFAFEYLLSAAGADIPDALECLVGLGVRRADFIEELIEGLVARGTSEHGYLISSLKGVGLVEFLATDSLLNRSPREQSVIVRMLADVSPSDIPAPVVKDLVTLLETASARDVSFEAAKIVLTLLPESAAESLHSGRFVKDASVSALLILYAGGLSLAPERRHQAWSHLLDSEDTYVRERAAELLIVSEKSDALALERLIDDPEPRVRAIAWRVSSSQDAAARLVTECRIQRDLLQSAVPMLEAYEAALTSSLISPELAAMLMSDKHHSFCTKTERILVAHVLKGEPFITDWAELEVVLDFEGSPNLDRREIAVAAAGFVDPERVVSSFISLLMSERLHRFSLYVLPDVLTQWPDQYPRAAAALNEFCRSRGSAGSMREDSNDGTVVDAIDALQQIATQNELGPVTVRRSRR